MKRVKKPNNKLPYIIGFGCGIIIYITMFIFGAMVMRGVMEEKTSRIAEVIVSSVKPFQLMMGKIIGIAAVGLTQMLLWIVFLADTCKHLPTFYFFRNTATVSASATGTTKFTGWIK